MVPAIRLSASFCVTALILAGCGGPEAPEPTATAVPEATVAEAPAPEESAAPVLPTEPLAPSPARQESRISGTLLDSSGAPVRGVGIRLLRETEVLASGFPNGAGLWDIAAIHASLTDEAGAFEFEEVGPGRWILAAALSESSLFSLSAPLSTRGGWDHSDLLVRLPAERLISGRVIDVDEGGLAGAEVFFAARRAHGWLSVRVGMDSDGAFTVVCPQSAEDSRLLVRAPDRAPVQVRRWGIRAVSSSAVPAITMDPAGRIEGFVHGPGGGPVAGAMVWATSTTDRPGLPPWSSQASQTDEAGAYQLDGLPAGPIDIHVSAPGLRQLSPEPFQAVPGEMMTGPIVTLREAASLRGRVLSADGRTVAGALVRLLPRREGPFPTGSRWAERSVPVERLDLWTTTDDDGVFSFTDLIPGESRDVTVIADAAPQAVFRSLRAGSHHELRLDEGGSLSGDVISGVTDAPLALAQVHATEPGTGASLAGLTDAEGRFQIHFVPAGEERVHAVAEGHAGSTRSGLTLADADVIEDVRLTLPLGVTVTGRVANSRDESPIPGADVTITLGDERLTATADESGAFRLDHVARGSWRLGAAAERFLPLFGDIVAVQTQDLAGLSVLLDPAAQIRGRVTDMSDRSVAGAAVGVRYMDRRGRRGGWGQRGNLRSTTTSADDGTYVVDGILPDREFAIVARHPSYAQGEVGVLRLDPGAVQAPVDVILSEGGSIVGRVIDEDERPIANAEVMHAPQAGGGWGGRGALAIAMRGDAQGENSTRSDPEGRFRFEHLLPGSYTLLARSEDRPYETAEDVEVAEAMETPEVLLQLRPGVSISGRVVDSAGAPVAEANVSLRAMSRERPVFTSTVTGDQGSFELRGLEERTYTLAANAEGFDSVTEDHAAPGQGVTLTLPRAGVLVGQVIDAASEAPVTAFEITALRAGRFQGGPGGRWGGGGRSVVESFSDPAGRFEFEGLTAGTWQIDVTAEGYAPGEKEGIEVLNEQSTEIEPIALILGRTVIGQVVTAHDDPQPIPGATVQVAGQRVQGFFGGGPPRPPGQRSDASQRMTDEEGRFTMPGLPPGSLTLVAEAPGFLEDRAEITVPEDGEPEEVTMILRQGGRIVGRVVSARTREPIQGARIALPDEGFVEDLAEDLARRGVTSGSDGRFEMIRVPPGNLSLTVSHGDHAVLNTRPVSVRESEETDVGDLRLSTGGAIIGYVFNAEGDFLPGAGIFLEGPSGFDSTVTSDVGEFQFDHLPEGQYRVTMDERGGFRGRRGRSGTSLTQTVIIADGEETEVVFAREPGYAVAGRVTDAGAPVEGIQVALALNDGTSTEGEGAQARSGGDGTYRIENLSPGTYSVAVTQRQGRRRQIPVRRDSLTVSNRDVDFDIELPRSSVSGTVVNALGEPIQSADVYVIRDDSGSGAGDPLSSRLQGQERTRTGGVGEYQFSRVQEGEVTLLARRQDADYGYQTQDLAIGFGDELTGINFTLPDAGRLTGRALVGANGGTIPSFSAEIINEAGTRVYGRSVGVRADGTYLIDGLADGVHFISAFPDDYAPIRSRQFDIDGGSETQLDLEFDVGGAVRTTVESDEGGAAVGALVEISTLDGSPLGSSADGGRSELLTDAGGQTLHEHLPEGQFSLRVAVDGFYEYSEVIMVRDGRTETVDVRLESTDFVN